MIMTMVMVTVNGLLLMVKLSSLSLLVIVLQNSSIIISEIKKIFIGRLACLVREKTDGDDEDEDNPKTLTWPTQSVRN